MCPVEHPIPKPRALRWSWALFAAIISSTLHCSFSNIQILNTVLCFVEKAEPLVSVREIWDQKHRRTGLCTTVTVPRKQHTCKELTSNSRHGKCVYLIHKYIVVNINNTTSVYLKSVKSYLFFSQPKALKRKNTVEKKVIHPYSRKAACLARAALKQERKEK